MHRYDCHTPAPSEPPRFPSALPTASGSAPGPPRVDVRLSQHRVPPVIPHPAPWGRGGWSRHSGHWSSGSQTSVFGLPHRYVQWEPADLFIQTAALFAGGGTRPLDRWFWVRWRPLDQRQGWSGLSPVATPPHNPLCSRHRARSRCCGPLATCTKLSATSWRAASSGYATPDSFARIMSAMRLTTTRKSRRLCPVPRSSIFC